MIHHLQTQLNQSLASEPPRQTRPRGQHVRLRSEDLGHHRRSSKKVLSPTVWSALRQATGQEYYSQPKVRVIMAIGWIFLSDIYIYIYSSSSSPSFRCDARSGFCAVLLHLLPFLVSPSSKPHLFKSFLMLSIRHIPFARISVTSMFVVCF